ncbi:MAG: 3-hydroxyacyl-CoA dehydrogenase NAD-binding domain-containing protein [Casimicrobiaceae bacterium]
MTVRYELGDSVAVIALDNPPVNGLGHATRSGIVEAIERANADAGVAAIVLIGAGKLFSGGADIREFNTPKSMAEPTLAAVIRTVEASGKPVVAAIAGTCMGGGLELALGCHWRVATPEAAIALPEVKLGILPGAGGTQRLPRVVGVDTALQMIVTGASVAAGELRGTKLFDAIIDGDLLAGALAFARTVVTEKRLGKRVRDIEIACPDAPRIFGAARAKAARESRHYPAPHKCIDAVEAAVNMPFDQGLAFERKTFLELVATPESRALRHVFFAERAAGRIPGVSDTTPTRTIGTIAVIGAGTMGTGIAMNGLTAGIPVVLLEMNQEALDKGGATIRRNYEASAERGKLTRESVEQNMALLRPTLSYDDLRDADLVIEAVFEEMDIKRDVFATLDRVAKPGAILATNTSTLDVNRIAAATNRPQDVIGMHFFSPANVMKLLEVVRGARTGDDVLTTVMRLAKRIGKIAVVSGVCDGFIGNRMVEQYLRQAMFLLEEGASPQQVDAALEGFGMAMGPFRMSDLAGNDVGWRIRRRRYVEKPHILYSRIADRLCETGRFGQKTGMGWYRYEPGRRDAIPDPAVDALIAGHRAEIGVAPRDIDEVEIVGRCVLALVNEGARILEEGIALRASDIDVAYVAGYGFPRYRGGPMFYAGLQGLPEVMSRMQRFAAVPRTDAAFWQPAPLLQRLVTEGKSFTE